MEGGGRTTLTVKLTPAQLALLIEGIDWRRTVAPEAPRTPALA
jgi:transposase